MGEIEHCPTCGQRVGTFTANDGTSYYLAVAEQEASYADYLRIEQAGAVADAQRLAEFVRFLLGDTEPPGSVREALERYPAGGR